MRENRPVQALPTKTCLADELGSLLRYGLGRSPRGLSEADVQRLSDLSAELVDESDGAWPLCIARAVTREIAEVPHLPERLAIGDMFGVELDVERPADENVSQIIEDIKNGLAVAPLEGPDGRYDQAGQRFRDASKQHGYKERYVKDELRGKWLEKIADRLLQRASKARAATNAMQVIPPSKDGQAAEIPPRLASSRLFRRRNLVAIGAAILLLIACYFVASLIIWDSSTATPPVGTIVNATTGQVVKKVVNRTTPHFVEVSAETSVADLTTDSRYHKERVPLKVHIGDIVEFSTLLFNPNNQPLPYLTMYTENTTGETVRRINGPIISRSYGGLRVNVHWPTREGSHRGEPVSAPVEIIYPKAARLAALTYLPGSTVLFDQKGQVLARLPDGIMEAGITLTDVGAPPSCSYCETEYARYVNFKVQITNNGHT